MVTLQSVPACSAEDHALGALDAPVVIIEYADFECPNCKQAESMLKNLRQRHGDQLCIVYRHFPLEEVHPYALLAAQASEAAGVHGKFWEMHDLLFEHQDLLDASRLATCAVQLGLDLPAFTAELDERRYLGRVRAQIDGANDCGVRATPTFFVNGQLLDVSFGLAGLYQRIETLLHQPS
jgi:protein-disulfide isomerase